MRILLATTVSALMLSACAVGPDFAAPAPPPAASGPLLSLRDGVTTNASADAQWWRLRSEEHTSELQSLMRISYAVFCLKKKNKHISTPYFSAHYRHYTATIT